MMIIKNIFKIIVSLILMLATLVSLLLTVGSLSTQAHITIGGMISMIVMLFVVESINFKK